MATEEGVPSGEDHREGAEEEDGGEEVAAVAHLGEGGGQGGSQGGSQGAVQGGFQGGQGGVRGEQPKPTWRTGRVRDGSAGGQREVRGIIVKEPKKKTEAKSKRWQL